MLALDGMRVALNASEMELVEGAQKWTVWNVNPRQDLRIRKRKAPEKASASGMPTVILVDDDEEPEPAQPQPSKKQKVANASKVVECNGLEVSGKFSVKILGLMLDMLGKGKGKGDKMIDRICCISDRSVMTGLKTLWAALL